MGVGQSINRVDTVLHVQRGIRGNLLTLDLDRPNTS